MRAPTKEEKAALEGMLLKIDNQVTDIKSRFEYCEQIHQELVSQTGDDPFRIRNAVLWRMTMDSVDMSVIDLASLCKSLWKKGGFFGKLNNVTACLRRTNPTKVYAPAVVLADPPEDAQEAQEERQLLDALQRGVIAASRNEAFERLFPRRKGVADGSVTQDDVNTLKDRFSAESAALTADRDANRAHRFEEDGKAARVALGAVREHFDRIEGMLNDIRLVALGAYFVFNTHHTGSLDDQCRDIVDLIRNGTINNLCNAMGVVAQTEDRPRFYWQIRQSWVPPNG